MGASKPGTNLEVDATDVMQGCKSLVGIVEGDSVPDVFIPKLVDLFMQGRFPFDKLIKLYPLVSLKPIIRFDGACPAARTLGGHAS